MDLKLQRALDTIEFLTNFDYKSRMYSTKNECLDAITNEKISDFDKAMLNSHCWHMINILMFIYPTNEKKYQELAFNLSTSFKSCSMKDYLSCCSAILNETAGLYR